MNKIYIQCADDSTLKITGKLVINQFSSNTTELVIDFPSFTKDHSKYLDTITPDGVKTQTAINLTGGNTKETYPLPYELLSQHGRLQLQFVTKTGVDTVYESDRFSITINKSISGTVTLEIKYKDTIQQLTELCNTTQANLDVEIESRQTADDELQDKIETEISTREQEIGDILSGATPVGDSSLLGGNIPAYYATKVSVEGISEVVTITVTGGCTQTDYLQLYLNGLRYPVHVYNGDTALDVANRIKTRAYTTGFNSLGNSINDGGWTATQENTVVTLTRNLGGACVEPTFNTPITSSFGAIEMVRTTTGTNAKADYSMVSQEIADRQYADSQLVSINRKVNGYSLTTDIDLDYEDVGAVPTTRAINGKTLDNNIALTASDVGALSVGGTAVDSSKLGGHLPSYYATDADLEYEISVRQNSILTLQSNIDGEVSTRASIDEDLQSQINTEIENRQYADSQLVPNDRTINGYSLSTDISLDYDDVGAVAADLSNTNLDNTSDLDKPISTATQEALDLKANKTSVDGIYTVTLVVVQGAGLAGNMTITLDDDFIVASAGGADASADTTAIRAAHAIFEAAGWTLGGTGATTVTFSKNISPITPAFTSPYGGSGTITAGIVGKKATVEETGLVANITTAIKDALTALSQNINLVNVVNWIYSMRGAINGFASLDGNQTVPTAQLPKGCTRLLSTTTISNTKIDGTLITADASTDTFTSNGHGLVNGDTVAFVPKTDDISAIYGTNPNFTGLRPNRLYYVVNKATNTFQLSLTSGGAAIDVTYALSASSTFQLEKINTGTITISNIPATKLEVRMYGGGIAMSAQTTYGIVSVDGLTAGALKIYKTTNAVALTYIALFGSLSNTYGVLRANAVFNMYKSGLGSFYLTYDSNSITEDAGALKLFSLQTSTNVTSWYSTVYNGSTTSIGFGATGGNIGGFTDGFKIEIYEKL